MSKPVILGPTWHECRNTAPMKEQSADYSFEVKTGRKLTMVLQRHLPFR